MISSIKIENFKSIKESKEIEIAPITLLMGPNSSGKSSILKPLLLMRQTADSRDIQRSVQVDGAYVSLGTYNEFVFNHDNKREVKFTVAFSPEGPMMWRKVGIKRSVTGRDIRGIIPVEISPENIIGTISLGLAGQEQIVTRNMNYTFYDRELGEFVVDKSRGERGVYSGFARNGKEEIKYSPLKKTKFYDMSRSPRMAEYVSAYRSELSGNLPRLLGYLTGQFEKVISNIFYLGPLRELPSPLYGGGSERPQDVGTSGEDAAIVLWVGRSERKQIELRRKVEKWIAEFEIAKNLKLHKLGPFFQLLLTDWHTGIRSNLTDVGFGASQLLPIIVAGYYAPEQSLFIAEQPEIHLHPKAQTLLADLLIDISRGSKKLLIETHSEHLMMRLQRRIADGTIEKEEVALYYCEPSREGTHIKRIFIDEYGQLEPELPRGLRIPVKPATCPLHSGHVSAPFRPPHRKGRGVALGWP